MANNATVVPPFLPLLFFPPFQSLPPMQLIPLDFLEPGESAEIFGVDGGEDQIHRLAELGIRQGAQVHMVQPGLPCILKVNDQRFTLRLDPQVMVTVAVTAGETS